MKLATREKAKQNVITQKRPAPSAPGDEPPEPSPAPPDGIIEVPNLPDVALVGVGPLPGGRHITPQPEEVCHTKVHRSKTRNGGREAELQQLPDPPSDDVGPATKSDDANAIPSKVPDKGSNPPEKEIIDLTTKEESPPATPLAPSQTPEPNEGPAKLKAGWVCSLESFGLCAR